MWNILFGFSHISNDMKIRNKSFIDAIKEKTSKGKINTHKQKRPKMWRQKKGTGYIIVVFQLILQQFNIRKYNRKTISIIKVTKLGYRPNKAVAHSKGGETHQSTLTRTKSGVKCLVALLPNMRMMTRAWVHQVPQKPSAEFWTHAITPWLCRAGSGSLWTCFNFSSTKAALIFIIFYTVLKTLWS